MLEPIVENFIVFKWPLVEQRDNLQEKRDQFFLLQRLHYDRRTNYRWICSANRTEANENFIRHLISVEFLESKLRSFVLPDSKNPFIGGRLAAMQVSCSRLMWRMERLSGLGGATWCWSKEDFVLWWNRSSTGTGCRSFCWKKLLTDHMAAFRARTQHHICCFEHILID